ncbi:MAG: sigma 54-interacting transcriptional regulator [Desulfobacterales bacterium]|nr:MAG: sigma 54-interacting transcriptional regulator [Desulfobacterales bacterium]
MTVLNNEEQKFLECVAKVSYANPFLAERIHYERQALGNDFDESQANWNLLGDDPETQQANTRKIAERAYVIISGIQKQLKKGGAASHIEVQLYEDTVLFLLYYYYAQRFKDSIVNPQKEQVYEYFKEFTHYWRHFFNHPVDHLPQQKEAAHIFACFFQVRRAFYFIFRAIIGRSSVAANLRAMVWNSIFTHDMRRYRRAFYQRMGDFATLIIGPTGSGKELVARAIGLSRYIPFDSRSMKFEYDFNETFFPINLSALPSTLVESELFGHRRGAFTGALEDRKGWLEVCPPVGTVFLDEIGELDPLVQVKLLRVLQARTFHRLGTTKTMLFRGKIVAATHRNIHHAMEKKEFREDFYYRLCSDIITTPSLHQQISETREVLGDLIAYLSQKVAGPEGEAVAGEVQSWIKGKIGGDYPWPGNIRELEQCVRNVMIRREYHPAAALISGQHDRQMASLLEGTLSLEDLCRLYCNRVYNSVGSYVETARRLKIDRRTVKRYVAADR